MPKRLYRPIDDRMLAGVCGGLGIYFNIDSTLIRLAVALGMFFSLGTAILLYVIAALIIPNQVDVK